MCKMARNDLWIRDLTTCIVYHIHYGNTPLKNTAILKAVKIDILHMKKFVIFLCFAQNIDSGFYRVPTISV